MSTGSISDADDFHEADLLDGLLRIGGGKAEHCASNESAEESSAGDGAASRACASKRRKTSSIRRTDGSAAGGAEASGPHEGKQVQRNAANARERARMRVLSKAFSRLKTTLPWVPPDTKLSKLDTLRLAASYIAHLRQILASDKHENGYVHPVNLTWPFMAVGKPDSDLKDMLTSSRLCGTTAS